MDGWASAEGERLLAVDRQPHHVHHDSPHGPAARHGSPRQPSSVDFDAELRLHNEALRRAWGVRRHDRVLDVGCGTGQTTREAARVAAEGSALGVDLSAPAIHRARELADAEGLSNVTLEVADAQVHHFPPKNFDLILSRFGTMFFDGSEWDIAIHQSLEGADESTVAPEGPDHAEAIGADEIEEGRDAEFRGVLFWVNLARKVKNAEPTAQVLHEASFLS